MKSKAKVGCWPIAGWVAVAAGPMLSRSSTGGAGAGACLAGAAAFLDDVLVACFDSVGPPVF